MVGAAIFHEPAVTHGNGGVVLVHNIDFVATCSHTLMPFVGECHIAYVPSQPWVLGLSKLARLVNVYAKRICSQAQLTTDVANAVQAHMPCAGVHVSTSARLLACGHGKEHSVCTHTSGCFAAADNVHAQVCLVRLVQCPPDAS